MTLALKIWKEFKSDNRKSQQKYKRFVLMIKKQTKKHEQRKEIESLLNDIIPALSDWEKSKLNLQDSLARLAEFLTEK